MLQAAHSASYRGFRSAPRSELREIKPASLTRQMAPIHHLFGIARGHGSLPLRENPRDRLQLKASNLDRLLMLLISAVVHSIVISLLETALDRQEPSQACPAGECISCTPLLQSTPATIII